MPSDTDNLALFVALEHERRNLEGRLDAIKKEAGALQELLLEEWTASGMQNANMDGLCIFVSHDFFCTKRAEFSTEQLIDVLRDNGLERCTAMEYNANSLKAFVRETLAAGSEVPDPLAKMLNFNTIARLKTRLSQ